MSKKLSRMQSRRRGRGILHKIGWREENKRRETVNGTRAKTFRTLRIFLCCKCCCCCFLELEWLVGFLEVKRSSEAKIVNVCWDFLLFVFWTLLNVSFLSNCSRATGKISSTILCLFCSWLISTTVKEKVWWCKGVKCLLG